MFKPFSLFMALRYLRARKSNHFISFVSLTSIVGLVLGVAVLIVVLSVMNGFGQELRTRILGTLPHGVLYLPESERDWSQRLAQLVEQQEIQAAAPLVEMEGMLTYYAQVAGVKVYGIDPVREPDVSDLEQHLMRPLPGLSVLAPGRFNMIVGRGLAHQLGLVIGDKLTLVLPDSQVTLAGILPRYKRFTIAGFFEAGSEIDGYLAYIHWQDAARLKRTPNRVEGLRLQMRDLFSAPTVMAETLHRLGDEYSASNWTQTHGSLFHAVKMEKVMVTLLLLLIVAVASFNMVSGFVMMVGEKQADIAILRTMGATPKQVRNLFLLQGLIIGVVGVAVGVASGLFMALHITQWVAGLESLLGTRFFAAYFVDYLPSIVLASDVVVVSAVAFCLSLMATWVPAYKALKTEPVEALRYE